MLSNVIDLGEGNYIYYEATGAAKDNQAILESPIIAVDASTKCMKFAYHMLDKKGGEMGQLRVELVSLDGKVRFDNLFENSKSEDAWRQYELTARPRFINYRVSM